MNADELRQQMATLLEPVTDKKPPYWEYWRRELWQRITEGHDPAGFMGWPCVYHTMLVNHWLKPVEVEFQAIMDRNDDRWVSASCLSPGKFEPTDYYFEDSHAQFSRNFIHQLYHLHQWEQVTGRRVSELETIVEFGGGYGAMALMCWRLGFRGHYYIYDLPEFGLLQQWFLSQFLSLNKVTWLDRPKKLKPDLLIALYSLSETPLVQRAEFLRSIKADSYLFLYSGNWEHYDNAAYFRSLEYLAPNWRHMELEHLPDRNNWYSIGYADR